MNDKYAGANAITTFIGKIIALFILIGIATSLWNTLVTSIFSLRIVTYWEMFGLAILTNILLKNYTDKK